MHAKIGLLFYGPSCILFLSRLASLTNPLLGPYSPPLLLGYWPIKNLGSTLPLYVSYGDLIDQATDTFTQVDEENGKTWPLHDTEEMKDQFTYPQSSCLFCVWLLLLKLNLYTHMLQLIMFSVANWTAVFSCLFANITNSHEQNSTFDPNTWPGNSGNVYLYNPCVISLSLLMC